MDFDFYLKVLKDKFEYNGDYRSINITFLDTSFYLEKKNDSQILIQSEEIALTIESSRSRIDENDVTFQNSVNHTKLSRVVIVDVINITEDTDQLVKVFKLLLTYFHVILFKDTPNINTTKVEVCSIRLNDVRIENDNFQVFSDPVTL